jgi:sulfate adenylyltransferase subunit 2
MTTSALSELDTITADAAVQALEDEALHILREVAGSFERPALLFSGGKDSMLLLHLASKAFWPGRIPFPVMHVDTGHNFPELLEFRDEMVERYGVRLVVASVQEAIDSGRIREIPGQSRNRLQIVPLLDGIVNNRFDAVLGGARRDEEKARAKERIFSVRDEHGQWDPRNQRPELWDIYNGRHRPGESVRVFPLSNWTELDVWNYIVAEGVALPPVYFAHERPVVERDGMLIAVTEHTPVQPGEDVRTESVRYRTVGDATCTAAVRSIAATPEAVVAEIAATRITERGQTRADDRTSDSAMEDRKREGYF